MVKLAFVNEGLYFQMNCKASDPPPRVSKGTIQSNISSITILVSDDFSSVVRAFWELITPRRKGLVIAGCSGGSTETDNQGVPLWPCQPSA